MGTALMISEFASRHIFRQATCGPDHRSDLRQRSRLPQEVSYGAAKAARENYTMPAAFELAPFGITANMVYPPVTDTG
jgi:3-oxoacyl-[acyl-carrier protein] reductase